MSTAQNHTFAGSILEDLRYALRIFRKNRSFSVIALLTLAIAIGANTAIFSVVHAVLLKPLPYDNPQQLTMVWTSYATAKIFRAPASGPQLDEMRKRSRLFKGIAGIWVSNLTLANEGEPEVVKQAQVTADFFSVLGVHTAMGRTFLPEEEGANKNPVAIISDGLWRRRYGADPDIVGKTIRSTRGQFTVIGVLPHGFELLFPADAAIPREIHLWSPFSSPLGQRRRDIGFLRMIGRLQSGVSVQQAQAEMDSITRDLRTQYAEFGSDQIAVQVIPLQADAMKEVRLPLLALFAGVSLVLLLACANITNLMLAFANERTREITMRAALGATRVRILRQLLTESLLLASLGGVLGLGLAVLLLKTLPLLAPTSILRLSSVAINIPTLLFAAGLCLGAGVIFGLAPALGASNVDLVTSLKKVGKNLMSGRGRLRRVLILAEVTFAFILLIGAGLMLRTLAHLLLVDPGFESSGVLTFTISLPGNRYGDDSKVTGFFRQLEKDLSVLPGVQGAGSTSHVPLDEFSNWYNYYYPEGASEDQQKTQMADFRCISPSYFSTIKTPLLAGRYFNETDDMAHPRVVIVDDLLAQKTWPGQSALGKKLNVEAINEGEFKPVWAEVVGVVKHVDYQSLLQQGRPQVYHTYMQSPRGNLPMSFVVRSSGSPGSLTLPVKQAIAHIDKDLAITRMRSLDDLVDTARSRTRFTSFLSGMLGVIAMFLACVGIYGVTSYSVTQATNEIGIRMAMGAHRRDILRLVIRQSMSFVLMGVLLGAICSAALAPGLSSLLFQVKPIDLLTFNSVIVLLLVIGLLACVLPAMRASRVDPNISLRYE
jgi:predicted permease